VLLLVRSIAEERSVAPPLTYPAELLLRARAARCTQPPPQIVTLIQLGFKDGFRIYQAVPDLAACEFFILVPPALHLWSPEILRAPPLMTAPLLSHDLGTRPGVAVLGCGQACCEQAQPLVSFLV